MSSIEEVEVQAGLRPRQAFIVRPVKTPNNICAQFFEKPAALFKILPHPPFLNVQNMHIVFTAYSLYSD
jgi:hypothetical protein